MKPRFLSQPNLASSVLNKRAGQLEQLNAINWRYETLKRESTLNKVRFKMSPRRPSIKYKELAEEHECLDAEIIEEMMAHDNDYL